MKEMISVEKIKLIIWDLDDTLWMGTISEGEVKAVGAFVSLIQKTTDAGIVHSICSKNDFGVAKQKLQEIGIWDFFVFPSINWEPKGNRIKTLIADMKLRPENVLFIDDNLQNLKEAAFYCEHLMTLSPEKALELAEYPFQKTDPQHKRLKQYKVLEAKMENQKEYSSNEDFLFSCNIQVSIQKDCLSQVDRLYDLAMRSNQLNYTKNRCSKDELIQTFKDPSVDSGYITVTDRFGDYGIVGFYCINIKENKAIHFLFSCRTLGMLVEQYVYMQLHCPEIDVVGGVVTALNDRDNPPWINQTIYPSTPPPQIQRVKRTWGKRYYLKGRAICRKYFLLLKKTKILNMNLPMSTLMA